MIKHILISIVLISVALCTPTCTAYCNSIMTNCVGNNYQYTDMGVCMSSCAAFPIGADADTSGNTVGCRTYHAGAAAGTGATTHCPHAGPSGGLMCGSYCEAYCNLTATACTGANKLSFTDYGTCFAVCNNTYDQSGKTLPLDTSGATVQCKIYHATVASNSSSNAATHCPHTSQSGQSLCGTPCENYCYTATHDGCSGQNVFPNNDCAAFCAEFPKGSFNDTSGNTVECRIYHWGVASTSASNGVTHCPHGTPSGANVCGDLCDVYCQLAGQNCPGSLALYTGATNTSDCKTACAKFSVSGNPGDTAGDTIYCRIYHLGVAGQSSTLATTHCPHGLTASAVCQSASSSSSSSSSTGSASTIVLSVLGLFVVLFF